MAEQGKINYGSKKVEEYVEALGYTPEDVQKCLMMLEDYNFQESILYDNANTWLDVYRIKFNSPTGEVDDLYIKLKITRSCLLLVIQSFHPARYE